MRHTTGQFSDGAGHTGSGAETSPLFVRKPAKIPAAGISPQFVWPLIRRVDFTLRKRTMLKGGLACAVVLGLGDVVVEARAGCLAGLTGQPATWPAGAARWTLRPAVGAVLVGAR